MPISQSFTAELEKQILMNEEEKPDLHISGKSHVKVTLRDT